MGRNASFLCVGVGVMLMASAAVARQDKLEICHVPPDDPSNAHTIIVAASALAAHLAHGDSLGGCTHLVGVCHCGDNTVVRECDPPPEQCSTDYFYYACTQLCPDEFPPFLTECSTSTGCN